MTLVENSSSKPIGGRFDCGRRRIRISMATRNRGNGRADCPIRLLRLYHYQLAIAEILSTAEAELGRPDPTDERQNGIEVGVFNDGFWPRYRRPYCTPCLRMEFGCLYFTHF